MNILTFIKTLSYCGQVHYFQNKKACDSPLNCSYLIPPHLLKNQLKRPVQRLCDEKKKGREINLQELMGTLY